MKINFINKSLLLIITIVIFGAFSSCEKENAGIETGVTTSAKATIDYNRIKVINGMLCFESLEHYASVVEALGEICESRTQVYIENLIKKIGVNDEEKINDVIEQEMFSQFTPLLEFCSRFSFNSLYPVLENKEKIWMDTPNSPDSDNPFGSVHFSRYQSALHNVKGDVMIGSDIFNPQLEESVKAACIKSASNSVNSSRFSHGGKTRYIAGKLGSSQLYVHGSTTLYTVKNNGKRLLWFSSVTAGIGGIKSRDCGGVNNFNIGSKSRNYWGCHADVWRWPGVLPCYIIQWGKLNALHRANNAGRYANNLL